MGPELLIGMQVLGTVMSTVSEINNADGQADIANSQARLDTMSLESETSRERAQAAIDARGREERLASALARQRAAMAGVVELNSGTPFRLQETTQSAINREGSSAKFASDQNLLNINLQKGDVELNRIGQTNAASAKKSGALMSGVQSIGGTVIENRDLF